MLKKRIAKMEIIKIVMKMQMISKCKVIKEVEVPIDIWDSARKLGELVHENFTDEVKIVQLVKDGADEGKLKWRIIDDKIHPDDVDRIGKYVYEFLRNPEKVGLRFVGITIKDMVWEEIIKNIRIEIDKEIDEHIFELMGVV